MAFFHFGTNLDVDNILKPTLDALNQITYDDDSRLDQVLGVRQDVSLGYHVVGLSSMLAAALAEAEDTGMEFVFLQLGEPAPLVSLMK